MRQLGLLILAKLPLISIILGIVLLTCLISFLPCIYYENFSTPHAENGLFDRWHKCVSAQLGTIEDPVKMWIFFHNYAKLCDMETNIQLLPIVSLRNRDETKYALLPVNVEESSSDVLLTLGIGNDIRAEKALQQKLLQIGRNITFYGADPITDMNDDLYSTIGTFFPFAIGDKAGFSEASVFVKGKYVTKNVVYVDLIYFLIHVLGVQTFDHIWFDAEGAEYDLFDMFYKNGRFDHAGITFCQMSLEVHHPNYKKKQQFHAFIKQLLIDRRFAFFNSQNVGHMRMWLFNFENPYCRQKYLPLELIT